MGSLHGLPAWAASRSTFKAEYIDQQKPFSCSHYVEYADGEADRLTATVNEAGEDRVISGGSNGPIDAFIDAFQREFGNAVQIIDYQEHAVGGGAGATAICFLETAQYSASPCTTIL